MTVLDRGTAGGAVRYDDDADLVIAAQAGDADAFGTLFDRWFDRVHDVAYRIVRDREVAAEVAQDVFLVAWTHLNTIEQPASFGGWLLRTSRNRSLNRLDRERRTVAVSDEETVMHRTRDDPGPDPGDRLHRAEQVDLVWAAAAALGERDASVLDLHLRHGLAAPELAEALGVTANNAHQLLFRLRKRLAAAVRGWVLWRGGQPVCVGLATALRVAGITAFGPAAVVAIEGHADGCDACASRREQRLAPEAMFAAVPLVAVAPLVKSQAAGALEAAGVPMQGSTALGSGGPSVHDGPGSDDGHGPGDGGDGGGPSGPGPTTSHRARRRRRRHAEILAAAAIVLIVAATMLLAKPLDELEVGSPVTTGSTTDPTTTQGPSSTASTAPSSTIPSDSSVVAPPDTAVEPTVPTPTSPPPPPTPPDSVTTTVTTDQPPADPPVIGGFRITQVDEACTANDVVHTATWSTADATSATIGAVGGPPSDVPTSGTTTLCAPPGTTFVLSVSGPGGEASDTASAPR